MRIAVFADKTRKDYFFNIAENLAERHEVVLFSAEDALERNKSFEIKALNFKN